MKVRNCEVSNVYAGGAVFAAAAAAATLFLIAAAIAMFWIFCGVWSVVTNVYPLVCRAGR